MFQESQTGQAHLSQQGRMLIQVYLHLRSFQDRDQGVEIIMELLKPKPRFQDLPLTELQMKGLVIQ